MIGADFSNNNGTVDWSAVKAAGIQFAFIKASEGTASIDGFFQQNRAEAARVGIPVGPYHFARPDFGTSPIDEARFFVSRVGSLQKNELRPVLDLELGNPAPKWAIDFLNETERLLGVRPILYSYPDFLSRLVAKTNAEYLRQWPLWLASYSVPPGGPYINDFGFRVVCHQYTAKSDINADGNFATDVNELRESGDYLLWRDWQIAGAPQPRPAGLPATWPNRWKDALPADALSIQARVGAAKAPLQAQIDQLQQRLTDSQQALAAALEKIDKAKAALGG